MSIGSVVEKFLTLPYWLASDVPQGGDVNTSTGATTTTTKENKPSKYILFTILGVGVGLFFYIKRKGRRK